MLEAFLLVHVVYMRKKKDTFTKSQKLRGWLPVDDDFIRNFDEIVAKKMSFISPKRKRARAGVSLMDK